jgi:nitrite reductase/ring-hydroxylating ferredoxin subunit
VALVDVGAYSDFKHSVPVIVTLDRKEIGILRWHDEVFALRNVCPHQGGPLCAGLVGPNLVGGNPIGGVEAELGNPVVSCPWHGWEFTARTGKAVWDEKYGVRAYRTVVENGRVLVETGSRKTLEGERTVGGR